MPTILLVTVYPCRNSYRLQPVVYKAIVNNPTFFHHKWAVARKGHKLARYKATRSAQLHPGSCWNRGTKFMGG